MLCEFGMKMPNYKGIMRHQLYSPPPEIFCQYFTSAMILFSN